MRSSAAAWCLNAFLSGVVSVTLAVSARAQSNGAQNQSPSANSNPNYGAQSAPNVPTNTAPKNDAAPPQGNSAQGNLSQGNPSQQPSTDQTPISPEPGTGNDGSMFVFKKQVEEVVLHATVYDQDRNLVTNLSKDDFSVVENGVRQQITSFRREDVPVAIGVVVDNSGSMRDKRDKVNQAVLNLLRASNSDDQIFVVNFGERPYLDQDFTSNENLLRAALHQVSSRGSTALYDAVVASDVHLKDDSNLEKKVLLVITDGEDNMSQETLQEASQRLQQVNGPVVYAIGLLGSGLQRSGRQALEDLASGTGGVAYFPDSLDQVDNITRTIAHDIRSQFRIAYKPTNQNIQPQFKSVQVEAHAPGYPRLTVRTRSGYYSSEPGH
jgi:Ca-activated chloride channel homolog